MDVCVFAGLNPVSLNRERLGKGKMPAPAFERAIMHVYNIQTRTWQRGQTSLAIEPKSFSEGP